MTSLSDRIAAKAAPAFTKLGAAGSVVTGVGTATSVTTAATLVGPINDFERYTATGASTKGLATFYVQAADLPAVPRLGDQVAFGGNTYGILAVESAEVHGVDLLYTLDVEEIGNG